MNKNQNFHEFVVSDLLTGIDGISSKALFGGYGIYKNGVIFAVIADATLYFRVDAETKKDYQKHSSEPFVYQAHTGKKVAMAYWRLPDRIMEDREKLVEWVDKAVAASSKAKKNKQ